MKNILHFLSSCGSDCLCLQFSKRLNFNRKIIIKIGSKYSRGLAVWNEKLLFLPSEKSALHEKNFIGNAPIGFRNFEETQNFVLSIHAIRTRCIKICTYQILLLLFWNSKNFRFIQLAVRCRVNWNVFSVVEMMLERIVPWKQKGWFFLPSKKTVLLSYVSRSLQRAPIHMYIPRLAILEYFEDDFYKL